jgi:hypothetical protein
VSAPLLTHTAPVSAADREASVTGDALSAMLYSLLDLRTEGLVESALAFLVRAHDLVSIYLNKTHGMSFAYCYTIGAGRSELLPLAPGVIVRRCC